MRLIWPVVLGDQKRYVFTHVPTECLQTRLRLITAPTTP